MAMAGVQAQTSPTSAAPEDLRRQVQSRLKELCPTDDGLLSASAREALLGPGKRGRPVLAMLAAEHVGGRPEAALDFGCAVEMVHSASLILDDLPCMDNAALRRGAPTLHRSRGEDAAILAAIALLNEATRVILRCDLPPEERLEMIDLLTGAVGFDGLAEGQMRDLREPAEARDAGGLRRINDMKTGALFAAATRGGGLLGGGEGEVLDRLGEFGEAIGFAFQLCDDLIDARSTSAAAGKDVGKDQGMVTFVDLWGEGRVTVAIRQSLSRAADAVGADAPLTLYALDLFRHADVGV
jgi:geranylgeranyl diphosphate synthase, type II